MMETSSGVDRDNHHSGLLGEPSSLVLVKVPGRANGKTFMLWMEFLMKAKICLSSSRRTWVGIE